jgi:hypothetical protein
MKKVIMFLAVLYLFLDCLAGIQAKEISLGLDIINITADKQYDEDGKSQDSGFTTSELRIPISAGMLLLDSLHVGIAIPYVSRSIKNTQDMSDSGLGDVDLFVNFMNHNEESGPVNMNGTLAFTLPTGKSTLQDTIDADKLPTGGPMTGTGSSYASSFGGGTYNMKLSLGLQKEMGSLTGYIKLGYLLTMETEAKKLGNAKFDYGDTTMYTLAVKYPTGGLLLGLAIEGASTGSYKISGTEVSNTDSNIINIVPKVKATVGENLHINGGFAIPIAGTNENNGVTIRIGIRY